MEQFKEIINDPVKLEALIKDSWTKMDPKGTGAITYEEYFTGYAAIIKSLGLPEEKPPTEEEMAAGKKIADPNGTGKINFEGFKALMHVMIEDFKKEGK